jgi:hypothetical protein
MYRLPHPFTKAPYVLAPGIPTYPSKKNSPSLLLGYATFGWDHHQQRIPCSSSISSLHGIRSLIRYSTYLPFGFWLSLTPPSRCRVTAVSTNVTSSPHSSCRQALRRHRVTVTITCQQASHLASFLIDDDSVKIVSRLSPLVRRRSAAMPLPPRIFSPTRPLPRATTSTSQMTNAQYLRGFEEGGKGERRKRKRLSGMDMQSEWFMVSIRAQYHRLRLADCCRLNPSPSHQHQHITGSRCCRSC